MTLKKKKKKKTSYTKILETNFNKLINSQTTFQTRIQEKPLFEEKVKITEVLRQMSQCLTVFPQTFMTYISEIKSFALQLFLLETFRLLLFK